MTSIKQYLIDEAADDIAAKENEMDESDKELGILNAKLKVEKKASDMQDVPKDLREDFKYSIQALENIIDMEQTRNAQLKKDLEVLKYRKAVIKSQFSDRELDGTL